MNFFSKFSGKTKLIAGVLVVCMIGFGGYKYWDSKKASQSTGSIRTVKVQRGDVVSTVSATGTLSLEDSVDVSSKITGRIVEVRFKENDKVKAGDILFKLDDATYKSDLKQNAAKLENIRTNYARNQQLFARGAISKLIMDESEMNYLVAQANYDKSADNLADTVITAPLNGVVIGEPIKVGQTVSPGISTPMVLMTIGDMSSMRIAALVDESDIGRIKDGQRVTFTVDSYQNEEFEGYVQLISRKSVTQQSVIYYTVYVKVKDTKDKLLPGMTARTNIMIAESKNTLYIPQTAIREAKNGKFVQVMTKVDGKDVVTEVPVTTGLSGENGVEIKSGLTEGETVVMRTAKNNSATNNMRPGPGMRL